jgi:hypothetical protein
MDHIEKIILQNGGIETSNGEYIRNPNEDYWFFSENGSHIEKTIEGWYVFDAVLNEQTYMFDENFKNIYAVGDCIIPTPDFLIFKN